MPILTLNTNVSKDKITPQLLKEISALVAESLGKPEAYVAVHIQPEQAMLFGGTEDDCVVGVLKSIGGLGGSKNNQIAKKLFPVLSHHLDVSGERVYLEFINVGAADLAHNGRTFA